MNNFFSILLIILGGLFANQTTYWSLGLVINNKKPQKVIVQKSIDLNTFLVEKATHIVQPKIPANIYTLKTNYLIEPTSINIDHSIISEKISSVNIKELILNQEYFEAAKQIIFLEEENKILEQFSNWNDFYYWAGFIYYNLGNHDLAYENIQAISNRENNPETLFLEALIIKDCGNIEKSNSILQQIIKEFPNNDYSNYAKNILIDE